MIKLSASYGLKVPAAQEFSSESYHASTEIELADTVRGDDLKAALGALWNDLRAAVAAQRGVAPAPQAKPAPAQQQEPPAPRPQPVNRIAGEGASKKQIGFLLALARRKRNLSAEQLRTWLQSERGLSLQTLSKADAAAVIDELNGN